MRLQEHCTRWVETILALSSGFSAQPFGLLDFTPQILIETDPKLHVIPAADEKPKVAFRQVRYISSLSLADTELYLSDGVVW